MLKYQSGENIELIPIGVIGFHTVPIAYEMWTKPKEFYIFPFNPTLFWNIIFFSVYYYTNEIVNFLFEYSSEVFFGFLFVYSLLSIHKCGNENIRRRDKDSKKWGPKKKERRQTVCMNANGMRVRLQIITLSSSNERFSVYPERKNERFIQII